MFNNDIFTKEKKNALKKNKKKSWLTVENLYLHITKCWYEMSIQSLEMKKWRGSTEYSFDGLKFISF